jgi:hypothetical protein
MMMVEINKNEKECPTTWKKGRYHMRDALTS